MLKEYLLAVLFSDCNGLYLNMPKNIAVNIKHIYIFFLILFKSLLNARKSEEKSI